MSIVAFTGDLKISLNPNGSITITQPGENWGGREPEPDQTIEVRNPTELVQAIQSVLSEKSNKW